MPISAISTPSGIEAGSSARADLAQPLAPGTFRVGTQEIVVLRDETGVLRAFHNTCRHRGSQLCQDPKAG